jgi:flap endonuclease-1
VVGRKGTEVLTNEAGEVTRQGKQIFTSSFTQQLCFLTGHEFMIFISSYEFSFANGSHLQGMLNRTVRLLEAGIKPV